MGLEGAAQAYLSAISVCPRLPKQSGLSALRSGEPFDEHRAKLRNTCWEISEVSPELAGTREPLFLPQCLLIFPEDHRWHCRQALQALQQRQEERDQGLLPSARLNQGPHTALFVVLSLVVLNFLF